MSLAQGVWGLFSIRILKRGRKASVENGMSLRVRTWSSLSSHSS